MSKKTKSTGFDTFGRLALFTVIVFVAGAVFGIGQHLFRYTLPDDTDEAMSIIWVRDPIVLGKRLAKRELETGTKFNGIQTWDGDDCVIWAYEPEDEYDQARVRTLGHELLHCYKGNFHE